MKINKLFIGLSAIACVISHAAPAPTQTPSATALTPQASLMAPTLSINAPQSDINVLVWANEVIVNVYTFNDVNAKTRLKDLAKYFTPEGWPVFLTALDGSKILDTVIQNHYKVTSVALSPPQITAQGVVQGQYSWTVTMPVLISYANKAGQYKQYLDITLTLVYTGAKSGVRGLALTQFLAKQRDKPQACSCETS